jgi:hypothetical protein
MIGLLIFVFIVAVIIMRVGLARKIKRLENGLAHANEEIWTLTKKIAVLEHARKEHTASVPEPPVQSFEILEKPQRGDSIPCGSSAAEPVQESTDGHTGSVLPVKELPVNELRKPKDRAIAVPAFWHKAEKQIAENWTGIVGTVVLVLGIGFLGVYTALRMTEFFRFLMIVGCSAAMASAFFILRRKERWIKLALWMRSAAGAVFLFACLGAGGIPGLYWIRDPLWGLVALLLGITINLFLAIIGGKQVFASLHVLLGLVALTIAPQSDTTLIIGSVVAIFGIALTFREKWDYHLLLSISSFFAFHTFWYFKIGGKDAFTSSQNILGIVLVSAVCVLAACVHYRTLYGSKQFDKIPFLVHFINWMYFGVGLLMHVSGMKWTTIPLFAGAVVAFILADYARKLKIRWLHCTDTLIAQIITVIAVISLAKWGITYDIVMTILFLQVLAFTRVVLFVREDILYRAGIAATQIAGVAVVMAFAVTGDLSDHLVCIRQGALAAVCAAGAFALHWYLAALKERRFISYDSILSLYFAESTELSITGIMPGILLLCVGIFAHNILWLYYLFVGAALVMTVIRPKIATNGFTAGCALLILSAHVITWYTLYTDADPAIGKSIARGLPLFLLSLAAARWDMLPLRQIRATWFGIYLAVLHFAILSHVIFNPVSPLIPGVCWLPASLLLLEIARFIAGNQKSGTAATGEGDRYLLHGGYFLLAAFFIRHILVHLQSEAFIGFLKIRFIIEAIALATALYWAFSKRPRGAREYKSWIMIHPLFVEIIALFAVLTVSIEVEKYWHPLIWIASAFVALFLGKKAPALSRMKAYAMLFYWASVFQVTFLLGVYERLGMHWYERDWILGTMAIILQFCFLAFFYRLSPLSDVAFPQVLLVLGGIIKSIKKRQNLFLFYPLLICVTLFFYWTFSKSLLTLLFVLECFSIFVISIVLKERYFRYTALIGLAFCIIRLIFFDLARSTTLVKALVFLGVGLIMLGMHALYNRFKNRLFEETPYEAP